MRVSLSAPSFSMWCGAALSSHCFDFPALKDCTPELWATTNPSPLSYYCQKEKKQRQRVAERFCQWPLGVTGNAVHTGVCGISPKALCVWGRLIPKRPVKAYFWLPSLFKSPQQREIPDFEFSQLQVFWIGSTPGHLPYKDEEEQWAPLNKASLWGQANKKDLWRISRNRAGKAEIQRPLANQMPRRPHRLWEATQTVGACKFSALERRWGPITWVEVVFLFLVGVFNLGQVTQLPFLVSSLTFRRRVIVLLHRILQGID